MISTQRAIPQFFMVIAYKYSPHFQTTQLISYLPTPPIISAKSLGDSKIPGHPKRTTRSGVFNGWKYVSKSSSLLAAFTLWPAHKLCLIWISGYVTAYLFFLASYGTTIAQAFRLAHTSALCTSQSFSASRIQKVILLTLQKLKLKREQALPENLLTTVKKCKPRINQRKLLEISGISLAFAIVCLNMNSTPARNQRHFSSALSRQAQMWVIVYLTLLAVYLQHVP